MGRTDGQSNATGNEAGGVSSCLSSSSLSSATTVKKRMNASVASGDGDKFVPVVLVGGGDDNRHKMKRRIKKPSRYSTSASVMRRKNVHALLVIATLALMIVLGLSSLLFGFLWDAGQNNLTRGAKLENQTLDSSSFELNSPQAPSCERRLAPSNTQSSLRLYHRDVIDFTLVSQLSVDRLWMVRHQCRRWGTQNPISLAIFVPKDKIQTTKTDIIQFLTTHHQDVNDDVVAYDMGNTEGCSESQLTVQVHYALRDADAQDYPVNLLRRLALQAVKTTHVVYVDIDFWVSSNLHQVLTTSAEIQSRLAQNPKLALVLVAFQLHRQCQEYMECPRDNVPHMAETMSELIRSVYGDIKYRNNHKRISAFDPTNRGGHGSTKYFEFFRSQIEEGSLLDIPCLTSARYEPYLVFRYCRDLPPFQLAFSGYGKNKLTWMMQMHRVGYTLAQIGGVFVVHYPHLDSPSRLKWNKGPSGMIYHDKHTHTLQKHLPGEMQGVNWTQYKRGQVDALYVKFKHWLKTSVPDEAVIPFCDTNTTTEVANPKEDVKLWVDPATVP